MTERKKNFPYLELGTTLQIWRSEQYRTAQKFHEAAKLSFSYSAYAAIERGATLPSPEALEEITKALGEDLGEALLVWARVQMPTQRMKDVFSKDRLRAQKSDDAKPKKLNQPDAPSFENTWVFGPADRELFLEHPWLWGVCQLMSVAYPGEVPYSDFRLPQGMDHKRLAKHLKPWIQSGHIVASNTGLKIAAPFIYLPKSKDWMVIRTNNLKIAFDDLIAAGNFEEVQAGRAHRGLIHRPLTLDQATRWIERLGELEAEFKAEPYPKKDIEQQTHALVLLFGTRNLKNPSSRQS